MKCYLLSFAIVIETLVSLLLINHYPVLANTTFQGEVSNSSVPLLPLKLWLYQASELRNKNELSAAIAVYLNILKKYPNQRQARAELALTYAYNLQYQLSIQLYQQLLAETLHDVDIQTQLARVYTWQGNYPKALNFYRALLNQQPDNLTIQLETAQVTSWQGKYHEAIALYNQILQQDPDNLQAQLGIAQVTSWQGKYHEAIALYEATLQQNPGNLQAQLGIAEITARTARLKEALVLYNNILQQYPDSVAALKGQAQVTYDLGHYQKAITLYKQALERFPQAQELKIGLARIYLSQQKVNAAIALIEPLIENKSRAALQLAREIQAIQITTDFLNYNNNSGRVNRSLELTTRFRVNYSDTIQQITLGFNTFEENNINSVTNIPIRVGIEGNINQVSLRGSVGIDTFNRLPTAFNFNGEATLPIASSIILSGVVEQSPYKFNAESLANQITALRLGPNLYWQIDRNTSLFTLLRWGSYNDGNTEQQFYLNIERKLGQFFMGGSLFTLSYTQDLQNGYFAPSDFLLYNGVIGWEEDLTNHLHCRLSAALGRQRLAGEFTNANVYEAVCSTKISDDLAASLSYSYSNVQNQDNSRDNAKNHTLKGQLRLAF